MLGMSLLLGCRGLGSLLGPLVGGFWAGRSEARLRSGIVYGFLAGALGYISLGLAQTWWQACLAVIFAHAGGSTIWVFSTTILQGQTDDRFRGRVFSAEFAFAVVTMSSSSYIAGMFADLGAHIQRVAMGTGIAILVPAIAWWLALRMWRERQG